jgi:hypothetical protein
MPIQSAYERYRGLIRTAGKAALHQLYPNDFEVYFTALELVDSLDRTVEYFIFPNNPSSIDDNRNKITNIKKTATGVTSVSTPSFIPQKINLKGTFGKKLKVITGNVFVDFEAFFLSEDTGTFGGKLNFAKSQFNSNIKTGYGCTKIMERIVEKSSRIDPNGKPYYLVLYNLQFGQSYLVKPMTINFTQSVDDSNMLWNYNLSLRTLAPLENMKRENKNSLLAKTGVKTLIPQAINGAATNQLNRVLGAIGA